MAKKETLNWLQKLLNAIPHGNIGAKQKEIISSCQVSSRTLYRWIETGNVTKEIYKEKIKEILTT